MSIVSRGRPNRLLRITEGITFKEGKREGNMIVADKNGNIRLEPDHEDDPYGVFSLGEENRKLKEKVKQLTKKNKELKKIIENYSKEFVRC